MTPLRVALVAGEHSGDQLGYKLMRALRDVHSGAVAFLGVGGEAMEADGLNSLFPIADIAVRGCFRCWRACRRLIARIRATAAAVIAARPDALVIIDSPDFTHRVARRVRAALPNLPIVDYVSPSVWAWRPGRARAMRAYVDCVLALLPFEPEAYVRLGGPRCVYVGHPLIRVRVGHLRPNADEARRRTSAPPLIVALPGSRRSEVSRRRIGGLRRGAGGAAPIGRAVLARSADPAAYRGGGAGACGALAREASDCARRGGEIRRLSLSPRRARRVGDRNRWNSRSRRRLDCRRLTRTSLAHRGAAQAPHQGSWDLVAQPHPRRAGDPREAAAGLRAGQPRRGARRDRAGRPGARTPAPGAHAARDG